MKTLISGKWRCQILYILVPLAVAVFASCTSRYFSDEEAVLEQLSDFEDEYVKAAEQWNGAHDAFSMFGYFGEDQYRWGDQFIRADSDGYTVGRGLNERTNVRTLAEAAEIAGTTHDELQRWIHIARRLKIYTIAKRSEMGSIEIALFGSEGSPYGLRYAPEGQDELYEFLTRAVARRQSDPSDIRFTHLRGRWFYFEARR